MRLPFLILAALLVFAVYVNADQPQVNIGMSLSLTGKFAQRGTMQKKGYDLWLKIVNDKGGLLGKPVNLVIVDDQSSPEKGRAIYTDLIEKGRVDLVVGPYGSRISEAIIPIIEKHKYPMLSPGASADRIWDKNHQYTFGISPPASKFTVAFLQLILSNKFNRLALVYSEEALYSSMAKTTEKWAQRFPLKIVYQTKFKRGIDNMSNFAKKIEMSDANVVFIYGDLNQSVIMRRSLKKINWYPKAFYASIRPEVDQYITILGDDAELTFSNTYWDIDVAEKYPFGKEFVHLFYQTFHHLPTYHAANAFAAGMIIEAAVEKTKSLNREKLRQTFMTMEAFTVVGRYGVDKTGKQVRRFPMIIQIQNGKKQIVWPKEIKTADPIFSR